MEGPPEEHRYDQHCEQGVEALLELLGHGRLLLRGIDYALGRRFLGGSGEGLLVGHEDGEGYQHGGHGGYE